MAEFSCSTLCRRDLVRTLAEGVRLCLGDLPNKEAFDCACRVFTRQIKCLILLEPEFAGAVRDEVMLRVGAMFHDPESIEKVMTDNCDPDHPYWLLVTNDSSLRHFGRHKLEDPPKSFREIFSGIMPAGFFDRQGDGGPSD